MKRMNILCAALIAALFASMPSIRKDAPAKDLWDRVEHHDANSNGVRIHYVASAKAPWWS